MTLGEKIVAEIRTLADDMDKSIPLEYRGSAGTDYKFGQINGLREAARIVCEVLGSAARGEICEHAIEDGDWCPDCNRAHKEAAHLRDEELRGII